MDTERLMRGVFHYTLAVAVAGGISGILSSGSSISPIPAIIGAVALITAYNYRKARSDPYSTGREVGLAIISLFFALILLPTSILYLIVTEYTSKSERSDPSRE